IHLADLLLQEANRTQTSKEKKMQAELARMMDDAKGKTFTMSFTDECFRSNRPPRIADQLVYMMRKYGIPQYLTKYRRFQLWIFKILGIPFSYVLIPTVKWSLRHTTS